MEHEVMTSSIINHNWQQAANYLLQGMITLRVMISYIEQKVGANLTPRAKIFQRAGARAEN